MNPVLLYFASGESLYSGAVLLVLLIVITPYTRTGLLTRLRNILAWVALALMLMSSPPFPWGLYFFFLAAFAGWFISWNSDRAVQGLKKGTTVLLAVVLIALPAMEWRHRALPKITGPVCGHLVVIGDSISSGIDSRFPAWPAVMQSTTGVPVTSHSRPGARIGDALQLAGNLKPEDRLVLLEIGGNDLLAGMPVSAFQSALDILLRGVTAPGRAVVMFELPLLPYQITYGQIQRRLAAKYRITLIPKRFFISVLAGQDATSDGLHLLPKGNRHMASLVSRVFARALKQNASLT